MKNNFVFSVPTHSFTTTTDPLIFRKELIYADTFVKDGEEFRVEEKHLQAWRNSFVQMSQNGIDVPLPAEHTTDPEKARGKVVGMELGINEEGKPALFGYIKFRDEEAAKLASEQVSIYAVPEFVDGKGRKYSNVIRHVAITSYPVVPNLQAFQELAASLISFECDGRKKKMSYLEFAKQLEIPTEDDDDDEKAKEKISAAFSSMRTSLSEMEKRIEEMKKKGEKKEDDEEKTVASVAASFSMAEPVLRNFAASHSTNRVTALQGLLDEGKITKAVFDDLKTKHCDTDKIALSFSGEGFDNTDFDSIVETFKKNDPVLTLSSRTSGQVTKDEENPVLKDAERRANASKN